MRNIKITFILVLLIVFSGLSGCSAEEKATAQRRNLMMPEKTDLPVNSKYSGVKKKKTYKPKQNKKNMTKKYYKK